MTSERIILCADIGTSSLKAALIDSSGRERAFAREAYPGDQVAAGTVLAADWEEALRRALGLLFSRHSELVPHAVCISGNGPTFVPVTRDGGALPPLHWHDKHKVISVPPGDPARKSMYLPRAAWFRENEAAAYNRTQYLFASQDWLAWRLGADAVTTLPSPAYTPYYWDDEQCRLFGLDPEKFPPYIGLGRVTGRVSPGAAENFGIPRGIPIVAGGPDFIVALIGVGALEPGIVCDRAGSSEGINVCSTVPADSGSGLGSFPHVKDGLWSVGAMIPSSGRLFEWFREITGQKDRSYEVILEEIIRCAQGKDGCPVGSGSCLFFPDLSGGSLTVPSALVSTAGLSSRPELGRAVVESIGFKVLSALDILEQNGFPVTEMRISGGQAKNSLWNQLKADISGTVLHAMEIADGELAGDACLALTALGDAADLDEACQMIVHIKETYMPNGAIHGQYRQEYGRYRDISSKLEALFP
ncbi:xylulokinase [Breznakiella homolactica]|uniref:FGGY-family carbohydrate kinase n=1 Tax=Breznakiella homolactica TaxID=2798577 RepID=A0A7T7XLZ3_9SPIR|nr:FGGY-family carbohydrate kinase [Breznakiella homolactica]QQO08647.1 FGGY-family carbohydrate kinase [Breznakiella homolactica]